MDHELIVLTTVVAAVALGILAQVIAHRWHLPALVILLLFGILFGVDGLNIVKATALGDGLNILVKLAVAIILFDGALNLNLRSLRESAREVRNLVTIGAIISMVVTTLIARFVAGFDWKLSLLFGSLMTVTGPTVIQPLLRRVSVPRQVKIVLEGEAILIDPIGAILAIAVLEILMATGVQGSTSIPQLLWAYFGRLLIGAVVGGAGAYLLSFLSKKARLIPLELSNLVALACVWGTFGVAEMIESEAGIMSAVIMGLIVQKAGIPGERQLRRFKETLTTLGISMLFILLAAKLELSTVWALGMNGLLTVLLIMFVARPAAVFLSTMRTSLNWKQRIFIAWMGPRGIIAASVASIFAISLTENGMAGGEKLLALTFLTIIVTVFLQGITAPLVSRLLKLDSFCGKRAIVVGANSLGVTITRLLDNNCRPSQLIDTNRSFVEEGIKRGCSAVQGNALDELLLDNLHAEEADTLLAVTSNSEVNVLICQMAKEVFGIERAYPLLTNPAKGANPALLKQTGGKLAFGRFINLSDWNEHDHSLIEIEWNVPKDWPQIPLTQMSLSTKALPLLRKRGESPEIVHADQVWLPGDVIVFLSNDPVEQESFVVEQRIES
jgi:NhaP-type Na+/H+ or K+/H+ antiporter